MQQAITQVFKGSTLMGLKSPEHVLNLCKELTIAVALNTSGFRLALMLEPVKPTNDTETISTILLRMRVEAEALATVPRMAKLQTMQESFAVRSVAITQTTDAVLEVTYNLGTGEEVYSEEIVYALTDEGTSQYRQVELATDDVLLYLMHGTLKGHEFGPDAE